jgi:hypothetical protein
MPMRRIDFLYSPPKEYPFALLYFTGSKIFNTLVRQTANDLGYTLNEHALSHLKDGLKGEPIDKEFLTEESILNFLGIAYVKPENRIGANSLIKLTESQPIQPEQPLQPEPEFAVPPPQPSPPEPLVPVISPHTPKNKTIKKSKDSFSVLNEITNFKKNGNSLLQVLTEEQLSDIIEYANNKYYCEEDPVFTDTEYDIIREYVLEKYPTNEIAKSGHTKCKLTITKNKVYVPSYPRKITQNQLYSLNAILQDNRKTRTNINDNYITDVIATIPVDPSEATILTFIDHQPRFYFGPVRIEKLEIKLKDDNGNFINLNGTDWGFSIIVEQLYQK